MIKIAKAYYKRCVNCQWGKTYIAYDDNGQFNGESSPLWKNSSPGCFLFQAILSTLMVVGVVAAYVIVINGIDDTCTVEYKPWIIGQLVVVFFSAIIDFLLYRVKYASDDKWFRLITLILLQCGLLAMIGALSLLQGLKVLLGMGEGCYDPTPDEAADEATTADETTTPDEATQADEQIPLNAFAKEIWMANFFISCITLLILLCKLGLLCLLTKNFYLDTSKFIAIATKPEEKKFVD